MSDDLTPHEHDDMRDLLIAGTQRIRPAVSLRARIAAGLAVALVVATVGGVVAARVSQPRIDAPALPGTATSTPAEVRSEPGLAEPTPMSDSGTPTEAIGGSVTRLPAVYPPAPGTHFALSPDPVLTANRFILGTGVSLEERGIDVGSAHGFQSVGTIHPWLADLKDDSGQCILIRKDYATGGWSEIVCDTAQTPARVTRTVAGGILTFTIVDDGIDVSVHAAD